jgi:iron complex transport system permease protein
MVGVLVGAAALSVLVGPRYAGPFSLSDVLWFRLPRLMLGIIAGGVLGLVGAALQGLLRNPLVDPFTLGVASGGALGSGIVLALGLGSSLLLPAGGLAGALVAMAAVYLLARVRGRLTVVGLVLAGVIVSFLFSSLLLLLVVLRGKDLAEAVFIMMGHLNVVFTQQSVWMAGAAGALCLAGCVWLLSCGRQLDIMSLSEETAMGLGIDAQRVMLSTFLVSSVMVGLVVSFTGAISFVGLVVPHLVRMMVGPRHGLVLPGSFVAGAGLLLLADVLARNVGQGMPLSVVTAFVGVPFFVYLLRARL